MSKSREYSLIYYVHEFNIYKIFHLDMYILLRGKTLGWSYREKSVSC